MTKACGTWRPHQDSHTHMTHTHMYTSFSNLSSGTRVCCTLETWLQSELHRQEAAVSNNDLIKKFEFQDISL